MRFAKFSGLIAGIGITLIWSSWMLATRFGLSTEISVYDLLALRFAIACSIAIPVLLFLGTWKGLSWQRYAVLALLGGLPQNILTYEAIERSPVAQVSVFMYGTTPIVTALIALLFLRKKLPPEQFLGTSIIFFGILVMSADQFNVGFDANIWLGNMMALAAISSFAAFLVYAERWQINISQTIMACTVLNGLIYVPLWFVFSDTNLFSLPVREIAAQAALQGLIPGLFAMLVTAYATKTVGASTVSMCYAMIPACATAMAVPLLGEAMNVYQSSGVALATLGIMLTSPAWAKAIKARLIKTTAASST